MTEEVKVTGTLQSDFKTLRLELVPVASGAGTHANLGTDQVADLINFLAGSRAKMLPALDSPSPPKGQQQAVFDPRWCVQPEPLSEGMALAIRHPGLGWLSFVIPPESLKALKQLVDANVARFDQIDSTPKVKN